ncbi:hypothetical protein [Candidatus Odyssella acanthamoebae]|nr:hypothetical protein [Candidatus Paracaedibacter acanthamoebae]
MTKLIDPRAADFMTDMKVFIAQSLRSLSEAVIEAIINPYRMAQILLRNL